MVVPWCFSRSQCCVCLCHMPFDFAVPTCAAWWMHQPGIDPGSHRWQRCILPLDHWCWCWWLKDILQAKRRSLVRHGQSADCVSALVSLAMTRALSWPHRSRRTPGCWHTPMSRHTHTQINMCMCINDIYTHICILIFMNICVYISRFTYICINIFVWVWQQVIIYEYIYIYINRHLC